MSEFKIIGTIDTLISTEKEVKFLMKFKNKYEDLNEKKYVLFEVIKEKKDEYMPKHSTSVCRHILILFYCKL